jgi:hypothetical protein
MYALFGTEAKRSARSISRADSADGGRLAALLDTCVVGRFEGVVQALDGHLMEVQSIGALRLERFDAQRFLRYAGEEWFDRLHGRCRGGVRGDGMNALFGKEAKSNTASFFRRFRLSEAGDVTGVVVT